MYVKDKVINNAFAKSQNTNINSSLEFFEKFSQKYKDFTIELNSELMKSEGKNNEKIKRVYNDNFLEETLSHYFNLKNQKPNYEGIGEIENKIRQLLSLNPYDLNVIYQKTNDPVYKQKMQSYSYEPITLNEDDLNNAKENITLDDKNTTTNYHTYNDVDYDTEFDSSEGLTNNSLKLIHNTTNQFLYDAENTEGTSLYNQSKSVLNMYNLDKNSPTLSYDSSSELNLLNAYLALQKRSEHRGFLGFFKFITRIKEYYLKKDIEKTLIENEGYTKGGLHTIADCTIRIDNLRDDINIDKKGDSYDPDEGKTSLDDNDYYEMENDEFQNELDQSISFDASTKSEIREKQVENPVINNPNKQ